MRLSTDVGSSLTFMSWLATICLLVGLTFTSACTFYGEHPARAFSDATGGEGLERVFWKNVQAGNWVQIERALASNYVGLTLNGTLDRAATIEQYRKWQVKDFSLGDLKTELNGTTIVVAYTIALNGSMPGLSGSAADPGGANNSPASSTLWHMMTVWQQQKAGWVAIAHSASQ